MTKPKTAVVYARFSTDLQKDTSIADQFADCERYAAREGLTIVGKISDRERSSATLFDRDGLLGLVASARDRKFDTLIVESLDRVSRDGEDLNGIFKRLTFHGVAIHTLNEGIVDDMKVQLRVIAGSMFLRDVKSKVRRGQRGRVREGLIPGKLAYGYAAAAGGKPGERVIDETEAAVVRRIFREYVAERSPRAIASGLTRDGIAAPGGQAWTHQSFIGGKHRHGFLNNPIYVGELRWSETQRLRDPDNGSRTYRPGADEDRITVPVPHLRIVDQSLWDAAQALRASRSTAKFGEDGKAVRSRPVVARKEHLLSGLLKCGTCGGTMRISQTPAVGSPRVACSSAQMHSACEHRMSYDLDRLQAAVLDGMRDKLTDPRLIVEATKAFHAEWAAMNKQARAERSDVAKRLSRVEVQIHRLVDAIANSDDPVPALMAKLKPLEVERAGLAERVRLIEAEGNVVDLHPGALKEYALNVERLHDALVVNSSTVENRTAFRNLIDTIVVHPTGKRMPYRITPYTRLGAIMGFDLFPTVRGLAEILAADGVSANYVSGKLGVPSPPITYNIICLGMWQEQRAA